MSRNTRQRDAILKAVTTSARPLSPAEILSIAAVDAPGIGIATVYREIKRLLEAGAIVSVELPGGAVLFEKANISHHHHFKCDSCSKVYDLQGCVRDLHALLPPNFHLTHHTILMHGTCSGCSMGG